MKLFNKPDTISSELEQDNSIENLKEEIHKLNSKNVKLKVELKILKKKLSEYEKQIEYEIRNQKAIIELKYLQELYFRKCIAGAVSDLGDVIRILEGEDNEI